MHQRSLDIKLKVFGPEHLEPAKTKVNMGIVYQNMGEYGKALDTYNEALPVLEATLGRNHLLVADTKNKCACVLSWSVSIIDQRSFLQHGQRVLCTGQVSRGTESA